MNIEEIVHGCFVAVIVFIIIVIIMTGISEYPKGAPWPGQMATLLHDNDMGGARTTVDTHHDSGLPHYKEATWK